MVDELSGGFVDNLIVKLLSNNEATNTGGEGAGPDGGDGFTGGGTAGEGGGGGGGFFGGAADNTWPGGGGGSYVQTTKFGATNVTITQGADGGGNGDSNFHGLVTVTTNGADDAVVCKPNVTLELDVNGQAPLQISDIDNGSSLCSSGSTFGLGLGAFPLPDNFNIPCSSAGATLSISLFIRDAENNIVDLCTSAVSVVDNIAPTAVCQDVTLQLDADGIATLDASALDGGSSDNCNVASIAFVDDFSPIDYDNCLEAINQGYTETLRVTDESGLTSTCTSNITVEDHIAPVLTCKE